MIYNPKWDCAGPACLPGQSFETGIEAGQRRADGSHPEGSISQRVDKNLKEMARKLRFYTQSPSPDGQNAAAAQPLPGAPIK